MWGIANRGLERQDAELKRHMDVLERPLLAIPHITSHGFIAPLFEHPTRYESLMEFFNSFLSANSSDSDTTCQP